MRQTIDDVLMHGGFTDTEFFGSGAYRRPRFHDVTGEIQRPLLHVSLHAKTPLPHCLSSQHYMRELLPLERKKNRAAALSGFVIPRRSRRGTPQFFIIHYPYKHTAAGIGSRVLVYYGSMRFGSSVSGYLCGISHRSPIKRNVTFTIKRAHHP